jgi:phosphatidylinositol alpha-mannosyltransferase
LLIAGPGDADDVDEIVPAAYRDRVTLLGRIEERDKGRVLRSADVFVAPNNGGESFGIVLLEAMAAGRPVIASDLDAFRAVLDDGRCGELFAVGDSGDLARVAAGLLDDVDHRLDLIRRGRAVVRQYDWDTVVGDVLAVYDTVAGPGVRAADD